MPLKTSWGWINKDGESFWDCVLRLTLSSLIPLLFISFLGMVGFPITPAFLGEDLLLSHASGQHPWFALGITIAFVVNGIALARMFLRLSMGRAVRSEVREFRVG